MNRRGFRLLLLGCDLVLIVMAIGLAVLVRYLPGRMQSGELGNFVAVLLVSLLSWPVLFAWLKLYGFRWGAGVTAVSSHMLIAVVILVGVISTSQFALRRPVPRTSIVLFSLLMIVGMIVIRRIALTLVERGYFATVRRRVLIIGNGPLRREVQEQIKRRPEFLYTVAGYLHSDVESDVDGECGKAAMVSSGGLKQLLEEQQIDEVLVVERRLPHGETNQLLRICTELDIAVSFMPQTYEMYVVRPEIVDLGGLPFIRLRPIVLSFAGSVGKRLVDLLITCSVIPFLLPVMLAIAFYSRMTTGHYLAREERIGKDHQPFEMYRYSLDGGGGAVAKTCHRLSLTELPQLINILKGDMSWVGPRPESQERVRHYSDWQRMRLRVRPGLTGLAQIHGLRTSHESAIKAKFDLQYIQSWSPLLDLSLLLQTVSTILARGSRFEQRADAMGDLSTGSQQS